MPKILIITDAESPQVNGVVTTLHNTSKELQNMGYDVEFITPHLFKTVSLPTYKEIKVAINPWKIGQMILSAKADYIHVATEGPLGLFATKFLRKHGYAFTTSYHTKMPEYVNKKFPFISAKIVYQYMKYIHKGSSSVLVTTESMKNELISHGFNQNLVVWGRGVDTNIFNTEGRELSKIARLVYVGRISQEKNLEAYFDMPVYGIKYVVGDGPLLNYYKEKYKNNSNIVFVGAKQGKELQQYYVNAEAFVFPSKTDTFGIVMLEAMACGTPVIAYPVTGPIDCVEQGVTGYLDESLAMAYNNAVTLNRTKVANVGQTNTWHKCTCVFAQSLVKA